MTVDPRSFFSPDRFGDVLHVAPISVGLSGAAVYSVTTSRGEYVLRVHPDDRAAWLRAVVMQRLAAEHGVAPPIEHADEERAASVSAKAPGAPLQVALAQPSVRPLAIADIVRRVRALHAIPLSQVPECGAEVPGLAESIWRLQVERPGFPSWAAHLGDRLAEASACLALDRRRVFSHNDLHPTNMLWDGSRVWLLDWERAGLAHPYSDLATLSSFLNLPDDAALALVAAQEGSPLDLRAQATFRAARTRMRVAYGAVFLRLVPDLTAVRFASLEETPTLAQCYQQIAAGQLAVGSPAGQAKLGAALLQASVSPGAAGVPPRSR